MGNFIILKKIYVKKTKKFLENIKDFRIKIKKILKIIILKKINAFN